MVSSLFDEVVNVLRWVWGERDNPFIAGDLQQALTELRHGRLDKIAMVEEQAGILDARPSSDRERDDRSHESACALVPPSLRYRYTYRSVAGPSVPW